MTATISPGSIRSETASSALFGTLGVVDGHLVEGDLVARRVGNVDVGSARRRRGLEHVEHLLGRADALGAGVIVGAERAQRQVGLGGQHEHEQGRAQVQVPVEQSQPDRDRDQRHRDVDSSSRISEDRNVTRSAAIVARR